MSLMRFYYDPFSDFDHLFDDAFNARLWPSTLAEVGCTSACATSSFDSFRPRMDLQESKDTNTVTATFELPGMKSEDVKIDLQQNRLTVSGESSAAHSLEESGYVIRERQYGKFSQTLQLPLGTKPEDVKAKMENGLLTITFPKTTAEQQSHRIAIQPKL